MPIMGDFWGAGPFPLSTKYILYVNSAKYKIFKNHKKYLSPTVFKTKRKNIDRYITFYFLLYLLWIVQVSRELISSQWKPPSFLVENFTLKSSILEKRPYAWNQIRTTFSGPSVSKILCVGSQRPQVMILDHFYTIHQMYGPQIFVFQNILRT